MSLCPAMKVSALTYIYFLAFCQLSKDKCPLSRSTPPLTGPGGAKGVLDNPDADMPAAASGRGMMAIKCLRVSFVSANGDSKYRLVEWRL